MEGCEEGCLFVSSVGVSVVGGEGRGYEWGNVLEGTELLGEMVDGCAGLAGDCVDFHFALIYSVGRSGEWVLKTRRPLGVAGVSGLCAALEMRHGAVRVGEGGEGECGGNYIGCSAAGWRRSDPAAPPRTEPRRHRPPPQNAHLTHFVETSMTNGGVDRSRRSAGNSRKGEIGTGRLVVWLSGLLPAMRAFRLPIPALLIILLPSRTCFCCSCVLFLLFPGGGRADANVRFLACVAGKG